MTLPVRVTYSKGLSPAEPPTPLLADCSLMLGLEEAMVEDMSLVTAVVLKFSGLLLVLFLQMMFEFEAFLVLSLLIRPLSTIGKLLLGGVAVVVVGSSCCCCCGATISIYFSS